FEAVWRESIEAIYAGYQEVVAGRGSLLEELEALLDRSRDVLLDNPDHTRFVVRMLVESEHGGLAGFERQVSTATEFFNQLADRSLKRGEITRRDRDRLVAFITTLLWGITTLTAFDPDTLDGA